MENANIELIRGHMDTIILRTMQDTDKYGLEILNEIRSLSDDLYSLKQPTLYSSLKRLEKQGLIESYPGTETNGANRTYYKLTEQGKKFLEADQKQWEFSRTIIDKLLSDKEFDKDNDTAPFDVSEFRPATKREKREKPVEPQIIYKYIRVHGDEIPENVSANHIIDNADGIAKEDIIDSPTQPGIACDSDNATCLQGQDEQYVAKDDTTNLDNSTQVLSDVATQEYKSVQEIQAEAPQECIAETSSPSEEESEQVETIQEGLAEVESVSQVEATELVDEDIEQVEPNEVQAQESASSDLYSDYQDRSIADVDVHSAERLDSVCDIDIKDDDSDFYNECVRAQSSPTQMKEEVSTEPELEQVEEVKADLYSYTRDYSNDYYNQTHPREQAQEQYNQPEDEYIKEYTSEQAQVKPAKKTSRDLNINNDADYVSLFDGAYDENDKSVDINLDTAPHSSIDYYEVDKYYNEADMNVLKTEMKEQGINLRPYFKNNTASFYSGNFYYSNKLLRDWSLASYIMYALFVLISYAAGYKSGVQLSWTIGFLFAGLVLPITGFVIWKLSPMRKKRTKFNLTNTLLSSVILLIAMVVVVVLISFFGIKIDISKPQEYIPALVVPCVSTIMIPLSVFIYALLYKQKHYRVG